MTAGTAVAPEVSRFTDPRDQYLAFGNQTPPLEELAPLAERLGRPHRSPSMVVTAACAYIDLAIHPETPDSERPYMVDTARDKLTGLEARGVDDAGPRYYHHYFRGMVHLALLDLYEQGVEGQAPTERDIERLHGDLLHIGGESLPLGHPVQATALHKRGAADVRGFQLELDALILATRRTVRGTGDFTYSRQSLLREDQPYSDRAQDPQAPWDVGISTKCFLDPDLTKVQMGKDKHNDPTVTNVSRSDLGIRKSADLIEDAITERYGGGDDRTAAIERLDSHAAKFDQKLGFTPEP
jgi:hypothetical protein